jgi:hypothetical protein
MHGRLQPPLSVENPMFFIMNKLPLKKFRLFHEVSAWSVRWPTIYIILHEMHYLFHDQIPSPPLLLLLLLLMLN